MSPSGVFKNQIDHVLIDPRHKTSVLDVHSLRSVECGSDHYLVLAKVRQRIALEKRQNTTKAPERIAVNKLKRREIAEEFRLKLQNRFQRLETNDEEDVENVERKWNDIKSIIISTTKEICGRKKAINRKPWLDEEFRTKIEERKWMKGQWLNQKSEEAMEQYCRLREETRKLLRKKKRQHVFSILKKISSGPNKEP